MSQLVLVDDSTTIQKIVELAFATEDVEVRSFKDPGEALDHLVLEGADVVLADITLPEVDGYELCRRIRLSSRLTDVPVVLLAGTFEPFDVQRAEQSGYSGSLTKPFEATQLVSLVNDLLEEPGSDNGAEPAEVAVPERDPGEILFEIESAEAAEPIFELRRDQCRPRPATLSRSAATRRPAPDEFEAVVAEVIDRATRELQERIPRLIRQVLRDRE